MEKRNYPSRSVQFAPVGVWAYPYEDIPPDDPQYIPDSILVTSDNKRLTTYNYAGMPDSYKFKNTSPANGFELPSDPARHKQYKYTKGNESQPQLQFEIVYKDAEIDTDGDGITSLPTYYNYKRVVEIYALLSTSQFFAGNKPHRSLRIAGAIPVTGINTELRRNTDPAYSFEYYVYSDVRHYWGFFDVTFTATHDTSETLFNQAPSPPERRLIGTYTETVNGTSPPAPAIPTNRQFYEIWGIASGYQSWSWIDGGYPKFKE